MKTINATSTPPAAAPAMVVHVDAVSELYAAALAFEPHDPKELNGLGDEGRITVVVKVGNVRRLMAALGKARGAS